MTVLSWVSPDPAESSESHTPATARRPTTLHIRTLLRRVAMKAAATAATIRAIPTAGGGRSSDAAVPVLVPVTTTGPEGEPVWVGAGGLGVERASFTAKEYEPETTWPSAVATFHLTV